MALYNVTLLSQLAAYVISLILSLCISFPLGLHQEEFRGHCLLFSTGEWQEADGQFSVKWASQAYCNYVIFLGTTLSLVSIIQIYRTLYCICKGVDSTFLSAFFDVIICIIICSLTAVACLIITLGFMIWCDEMIKRFPSCELAAGNAIDKQDGIDTSGFYFEIGTAQFASWGAWATWVFITVLCVLKLCRFHQLENIRVSMYRERQRLINNDGSSPGATLDRENTDQNVKDTI